MARSRRRKRSERPKRNLEPVRELADRVMSTLGVLQEFRQVQKGLPDVFPHVVRTRLRVVLDKSAIADGRDRKVARGLSQHLRGLWLDKPPLGKSIRLLEYLSVAVPLAVAIESFQPEPDWRDYHAFVRLKEAVQPIIAEGEDVMLSIAWAIDVYLIDHCRIDRRGYWVSVEPRENEGYVLPPLILHRVDTQGVAVRIGDGTRTAFPCSRGAFGAGILTARIGAGALGLPATHGDMDVYVSRHALERLCGREGRFPCGDSQLGAVHFWVWESLYSPSLIRRPSGEWYAELKLNGYKLGYFPLTVVNDKVIARTFLFLTMDDTPEGDALRARLALERADKKYLGLDDLTTFTHSDVREDPLLVEVLTECGCGHLFEYAEKYAAGHIGKGYAEDIRRYVGLSRLASIHPPSSSS